MNLEDKSKNKFYGIINYRKFKRLSYSDKTKVLLNNQVYEANPSPCRNPPPIFINRMLENLLTINRFYEINFENKDYCISEKLIEEILNTIYRDFLMTKNRYLIDIDKIEIEIRKKRLINDKIKILESYYNLYINVFNDIEILDFAQNTNLYLSDKNKYLESDFINDSLLYDFDYIFYSIIYNNANIVFSYVFNFKWDIKGRYIILNKIFEFYEAKQLLNYCDSEIKKLENKNSQKTINLSEEKQLSSDNKMIQKEYSNRVFVSENAENIFHKLLCHENVIGKDNKPLRRFKTITYNSFKIANKLHHKLFKTYVLKIFVEFLKDKYNFKAEDTTKFANTNQNLISKIEDFIKEEFKKLENSESS